MKTRKARIDQLLVERGFFESREKAQRAVMAGEVRVGEQILSKPGSRVDENSQLEVKSRSQYVGRGGLKLEAALAHFKIDAIGRVCLDIGASTGGFTDCLLQHGAAKVYAVDVGHGQLDWKLRNDSRVVVQEAVNARYLDRSHVPEPVDICTIDVAFISLTLILPQAFELLTAKGVIVALVKPQFELGRAEVGKGGIVREPELHQRAVEKVRDFVLRTLNKRWEGVVESPILGAEGNKEFLACMRLDS